jgi:hypothetical protein
MGIVPRVSSRFDRAGLHGAIVEQETIAIGTENEGNIFEDFGIAEGLLHARADACGCCPWLQ